MDYLKKVLILEENDIVIGKYMKGKGDKGQDIYKDMSTKVKLGNEGSMIDRVIHVKQINNGDRMTKIRTCQCVNQSWVINLLHVMLKKERLVLVMKKEDLPYTEDGIIPDIVLDPLVIPNE